MEILRKNLIPSLPDQVEEEFAIDSKEIFLRSYEYFVESFYIHKQAKTLEQLFELYTYFFKRFQETFIKEQNLREDFDLVKSDEGFLSQLKQTLKNQDVQFLLEYQAENLFNKICLEFLINSVSKMSQGRKNLSPVKQIKAFREFVVFKIIQLIGLEALEECIQISQCFELFRSNLLIRNKIKDELVFPLQKFILTLTLNNAILYNDLSLVSELCELLCHPEHTHEYLDRLIQFLKDTSTFEQFVEKAFLEVQNKEEKELEILYLMLQPFNMEIEIQKPLQRKFEPKLISLPKTFSEFNTKYISQKCSLCNDFSPLMTTAICLICDEVLCEKCCDPKSDKRGNLNQHAKKYHMGAALYLDIDGLGRRVINTPLNVRYTEENVYIDNLGQSFVKVLDSHPRPRELDFTKFTLNPNFVKEYQGLIINGNIRKLFFRVALLLQAKSGNGIL